MLTTDLDGPLSSSRDQWPEELTGLRASRKRMAARRQNINPELAITTIVALSGPLMILATIIGVAWWLLS